MSHASWLTEVVFSKHRAVVVFGSHQMTTQNLEAYLYSYPRKLALKRFINSLCFKSGLKTFLYTRAF